RFCHDSPGIVFFFQHIADFSVSSVNVFFFLHRNIPYDLPICQDCPKNAFFSFLLLCHVDPPLGVVLCIWISQTVRQELPVCIVAYFCQILFILQSPVSLLYFHGLSSPLLYSTR